MVRASAGYVWASHFKEFFETLKKMISTFIAVETHLNLEVLKKWRKEENNFGIVRFYKLSVAFCEG